MNKNCRLKSCRGPEKISDIPKTNKGPVKNSWIMKLVSLCKKRVLSATFIVNARKIKISWKSGSKSGIPFLRQVLFPVFLQYLQNLFSTSILFEFLTLPSLLQHSQKFFVLQAVIRHTYLLQLNYFCSQMKVLYYNW